MRGDHALNEIKAAKVPGLKGFRFATEAEILASFGCPPGYLGPLNTALPVRVVADSTVALMSDFVCGANQVDHHVTGVNWDRDLLPALVAHGHARGAACVIEAEQLCLLLGEDRRGDERVVTQAFAGVYEHERSDRDRAEFLRAIDGRPG